MPEFRLNQKIAVSVVFVSAMFMNIVDITIVNVALPTIGRTFHLAPTAVDGIVIAYLVSLAIFIPASGWLGDRFGGKRVIITAIIVFTAGSALCGVSQNMFQLVLARVLQGAGGGMLAPVGMAMLFRVFPPSERIRASSILTVPMTFAPALGPVLGGLLVTDLSWRWIFLVNVPLGAAAVLFGGLCLERSAPLDAGAFDLPGFLLGGTGLGLLMYGVSEGPLKTWSSPDVVATCAVGALLMVAMVIAELRTERPLIDLGLLAGRLFRSCNGIMFLSSAAFLGTLYLIPLYYQDARGLSALQSGLSTFPEAFGVMLGAQFATRLIYPRLGPRRHITFGLLGLTATMFVLTQITVSVNLWAMRVVLFTLGLMMGQVFPAMQAASMAMISPEAIGRASTFFNTMRQFGSAVGVAMLSTVLIAVGSTHAAGGAVHANMRAYHLAFATACVIAFAAVCFSLSIHDSDAAETMVIRRRARDTEAVAVRDGVA
ncbi:MAG TPA: MDR family MFS transporter [Acidimicrobiales bacterium]|nr:MDR family MFS transporter [Acidimicrobiales bacterium]